MNLALRRREADRPALRSAAEIAQLRRSNRLARRVVAELGAAIAPDVTTRQLDTLARRLTDEAGARAAFYQYKVGQKVYPDYLCASVNDEVVHGIPNDRPLQPGDVVSLDYGCVLDGWIGDTAFTWCVGEPSPTAAHLLDVTREALRLGIAAAQPGRRVFDIAKAVQDHVEANGCGVVRQLVGHGVGRRLHEPPQVPNFAAIESRRDRLRPGMVICIEPMITAGSYEVNERSDGWTIATRDGSLAAHFEHAVVILSDGPEILSLPDAI
ncbi:MAG: type I methionyl aminopeptidase [Fimbriimonadaceae bacterium]|nr:type I methionyl aminopeptidase [Fimbriimonadaceae bacterium]